MADRPEILTRRAALNFGLMVGVGAAAVLAGQRAAALSMEDAGPATQSLYDQRCQVDSRHKALLDAVQARLTTPEQQRAFDVLVAELKPVTQCPFCGCGLTLAAGEPLVLPRP